MADKKLVTRQTLCAAVALSYSTLQRLEKSGVIRPEISFGRLKRFDLDVSIEKIRAAGAPKKTNPEN